MSSKFWTFQATKPPYLCTNLGWFNLFWDVVRLNLYISRFLHIFIVTCVLHANSVCIFGKAMCIAQTQKDQKDFLWTCLLAGFHVTWFHHPSWPNCWLKLLAAWWGCVGPTRGRISDDKDSRNARWTISCETKSSLLSLVFSSMWLLSELPEVAQLSLYHLWPCGDLLAPTVGSSAWCKWHKNLPKTYLKDLVSKACPSKRGGLEALFRLPSLKLLGPWKLPETQQGQDRLLTVNFQVLLLFVSGKVNREIRGKPWGRQVATCETTPARSSDLVISSSWSRELQITSIKLLYLKTSQQWCSWERF